MPLFFVLVVAVIVVAASFRYVQQRREKQANDAAPLLQKRVIVSNKREKVINDRRSRQQTVTPAGSEMRYEASFRPENGGLEVVFRLDAPQYHALSVGDRGMLSYKAQRSWRLRPIPEPFSGLFFQRRLQFFLPGDELKHAENKNADLLKAAQRRRLFRLRRLEQRQLQTVHQDHENQRDVDKDIQRLREGLKQIQ
ncbi:Putative receptor [Klebsiella pneumoniae IS53]|nr:Putative receptor [Klebsiella pneumoniae IS53]